MGAIRWLVGVVAAALLVGSIATEDAVAAISEVWAVNDGEKVKREDLTNPNKTGNSAWDGQAISVFGARNEIVAFQVILEADAEGASYVDVMLEGLTHSSGEKLSYKPAPADVTDWRGREIERFTQHYLHITSGTRPGWFYNREAPLPDPTGWVPDALVPENAVRGRGGMPFDIEASVNQGVWFDIYIPKNVPAGDYTGVVKVTEGERTVRELPVTLRVYDFTLPDERNFNAMIFFSSGQLTARHGSDSGELTAAYHRLAHRHRVEFTHAYSPDAGPDMLARIDGSAFTPEHGYVGPGEGHGYRILPASFYGINQSWQGDSAWATADAFITWLDKVKPDAITFLYITDEPPRDRYPWIREVGEHLRANPGPGQRLPMFVTTGPREELAAGIDIWCTVTNRYNKERAAEQAALDKKWWVYNGHRPAVGTQVTDAPAVDPRVTPIACWRYGVELWFNWYANHWRHNHQSSRARQHQNVWVDPVTFGGNGGVNGDGVMIYPGQDLLYPDQDRGIRGPVGSIRMKNIRRGIQDYEYLVLAARNGLEAQAEAIAARMVPAAFCESSGDVSWSLSGSDWDAHRLELAELLEERLARSAE